MGIADEMARAFGGNKVVVKLGSLKDLGDVLGIDDCGKQDCPVHGNNPEEPEEERDALEMTPDEALRFAVQNAASGNIALMDGKPALARIYMRQSELWLLLKQDLRDRLNGIEAEQGDPRVKRIAELKSELSGAEEDKQELRAELERERRRARAIELREQEARTAHGASALELVELQEQLKQANEAMAELRASSETSEAPVS